MINLSKEPVRVTDHAVIRYLERAMNLNIEIVREHIAAICSGPSACGATAVRSDGVKFEIINGAVTTVVPDNGITLSNTSRERNQNVIARGRFA